MKCCNESAAAPAQQPRARRGAREALCETARAGRSLRSYTGHTKVVKKQKNYRISDFSLSGGCFLIFVMHVLQDLPKHI